MYLTKTLKAKKKQAVTNNTHYNNNKKSFLSKLPRLPHSLFFLLRNSQKEQRTGKLKKGCARDRTFTGIYSLEDSPLNCVTSHSLPSTWRWPHT